MSEVNFVGYERFNNRLNLVTHYFKPAGDGQIEHFIDGTLRAVIPPEGWEGYSETFPEMQPVIDGLTLKPDSVDNTASDGSPPSSGV